MQAIKQFELWKEGALVAPLSLDLFSNNKEILAVLRKNRLFSGRKAEFSGSIFDQLDIETKDGIISLKNVSH